MKISCLALSKLAVITLFSFFSSTPLFAMNYANWNPLADTGQTICYDDSGNEISCPASGEPLYGQDAQYTRAMLSYEGGRGNPTDYFVRDLNTDLVWQTNRADTNNDGLINSSDALSWSEAITFCEDLSYAGDDNWRLPNFFEMLSIIDYGRQAPARDPIFSIGDDYESYWTATAQANSSDLAFLFFSHDGIPHEMNTTDMTGYVRCVADWYTIGDPKQEKTPIGTYQNNGDETVTDKGTGLMWMQNTADTNNDSQLSNSVFPSGDLKPWGDAMKCCEDSDFAGYSDWRLPNIKELVSLFDLENHDPAINSTFFQCQLDNTYASSTTDTLHPSLILTAHFSTGAIFPSNRNNSCTGTDMSGFYVRCVRDEQSSNDPVTLSVNLKGSGSGTVHISPSDKDCKLNCTEEFQPWTKVTLTAIEEGDAKFMGWTGPCQGTDNCVLTLSESTTITASFNRRHDIAVEVSSTADYPAKSENGNTFWVRVNNLGTEQAENFTVDVTYTAGESDTDSWSWNCGDEIPEGVTCNNLGRDNNKVRFTLSMEPGKEHYLKGTFRNNESDFNTMTVAAALTYWSDTNSKNNGSSKTLHIDPAYLPEPNNLTLLNGNNVLAPSKNTIVFTHGWQSDNPDECEDYPTYSVEKRQDRLKCFAESSDIWTGLWKDSYATTGQAGRLAARNRSENALNKIPETSLNIRQYVWEGAYTDSGMSAKGYIDARRNVYGAGIDLGKKLIEQLTTTYSGKIHFVGHSLGTAVNAYAVKYVMEHAPYTTVQMTILDYPKNVDRIGTLIHLGFVIKRNEMSQDDETRWGFDDDFFSNVVENPYADKQQNREWQNRLSIDNYFAYSSPLLNTKLNTAGVGSKITGYNVYNHPALIDPNDVGQHLFIDEAVTITIRDPASLLSLGVIKPTVLRNYNDHSGVHQWYRWTMWPTKEDKLAGDTFVCREDRQAESDWNSFWGTNPNDTLNPCASGFALSIVQDDPKPFPDYNSAPPFGSYAAEYDLVGGHVDNYCRLLTTPFEVECSKKFPSESAPEQDMVAAAEETLPASDAAYMKSTIHLANVVNYMSLQYKLSNPAGAEFAHILIDGQIVWSITADNTEPDTWIDTGKLPLFFEKGEHEFMVVFNGMETDASTFEIKELTFYKDPDADNFAWNMFMPAILAGADKQSCYPGLSMPVIAQTGTEQYTVRENSYMRYRLTVTNYEQFPDELFARLPNSKNGRTILEIYDNNDNYIYGFLGLENLDSFWFATNLGETPPEAIYIKLHDIECNIIYISNMLPIQPAVE